MNLKEQYGKKYKVALCQESEGCYEIMGKRGYVRPYGSGLELYITSAVIAGRIERDYRYFKVKNHYDDATAFEFANDPAMVASACKWIKARKRFSFSPEVLERKRTAIARINASKNKPRTNDASAS